MVTITFADGETQVEDLGFLLGRFPERVLKTGEVIVPERALHALGLEGYKFTVLGKTR